MYRSFYLHRRKTNQFARSEIRTQLRVRFWTKSQKAAVFTHESSYCFQRVLTIAILSVRLSAVRPSVTRVDQSKTVQARITKSLPSAAWKTLVSETVKLYHKFEGGHPKRGR